MVKWMTSENSDVSLTNAEEPHINQAYWISGQWLRTSTINTGTLLMKKVRYILDPHFSYNRSILILTPERVCTKHPNCSPFACRLPIPENTQIVKAQSI